MVKKRMTKKEKIKYLKKLDRRKVIIALASFFAVILLVLLSNKTFFRKKYKNNNIVIDIPMFMYYKSDKNNKVVFKTIRKSNYLYEYFNEYLSNLDVFDYYICNNGKTIYYNEDTSLGIYNVDIVDKFGIKTIKIKYDYRDKNNVCG